MCFCLVMQILMLLMLMLVLWEQHVHQALRVPALLPLLLTLPRISTRPINLRCQLSLSLDFSPPSGRQLCCTMLPPCQSPYRTRTQTLVCGRRRKRARQRKSPTRSPLPRALPPRRRRRSLHPSPSPRRPQSLHLLRLRVSAPARRAWCGGEASISTMCGSVDAIRR